MIDPEETVKRSRDAKRIADLATIQQAINIAYTEASPKSTMQYDSKSKNQKVFCQNISTLPCSGSSLSDNSALDGTGWIKVDISKTQAFSKELPKDSINNDTYHYSYCANENGWEIDTVLESKLYQPKIGSDGGDDPHKFEIGSNLNLIDKTGNCKY